MIKKISFVLPLAALFLSVGLQASDNAKEIFMQKCNVCHKTTRPADISTLPAPIIMGVMLHVKENYPNKQDAVKFIADYVLNPQKSKAVCMPQNIDKFGLMPSQKGVVTKEEAKLVASWLFDNYPPKGFVGGMHQGQGGMMGKGNRQAMMAKMKGKNGKISPFLIKKGLPHFTKIIKKNWDNPELNLSKEQKQKLLKVRKETLAGVMQYKKMVNMIQPKLISFVMEGDDPKSLQRFVNKLSSVKSEATMVHLNCIYNTRKILTPEQYEVLLKLAKHKNK